MGMLDTLTPFSEAFNEGEPFSLEDAKLGPAIHTQYGDDRPAQYKIGGKWYTAFGQGLANQIDRMDDNDRKAMANGQFRVMMARVKTRSGQSVKLLVAADTPIAPDGTVTTEDIPL